MIIFFVFLNFINGFTRQIYLYTIENIYQLIHLSKRRH